jgi:hypothetical protein
MREQFFNPKGLTSTSANHVANLAKEFVQTQKIYINTLSFVGTNTQAAGHTYITSCATPHEEFDNLIPILTKISQATQLIAWLREGIKEKQAAQAGILTFEQYLADQGIECPRPVRESYITREDVVKSWNEDKYNAYLTAQTFASVFGEPIHPQGEYSIARKELSQAIAKPNKVTGEGRDLTVITKVPAYTVKEVDDKFFELQNIQREQQAKFNQYEHEITNAVDLDKATKDAAYEKASKKWTQEYANLYTQYEVWRNAEVKRIADLKISIPGALVDIYKEIQGLGK